MALLSRVAESLFWLGRYVERAESTARLLDVSYHSRLEPQGDVVGALNPWEALIATLGLKTDFANRDLTASEEGAIAYLTVDRENPSSIVSSVLNAREAAKSVRDYLSSETWVAVNRLHHATAQRNLPLILADGLYDYCDMVRQGAHLFAGTVEGTSLHDEGYFWLRVGESLERADMLTRIVDSKYHLLMESLDEVGGPIDRYQWVAVLRSVSGFEAFRRTHAAGVDAASVAAFLLLEPQFPRSLRYSLDALHESLSRATDGAEPRLRNRSMRLISDLRTRLQYESSETLVAAGLHEYIFEVQQSLGAVSNAVHAAFFWSGSSAA
ncbi:hypothetical protein AYO38_03220 [bacterium SCGC AG-212-C10]|nr:hypothetical protein AYO38_03220 [bacterium SCGC AG-212-C10]